MIGMTQKCKQLQKNKAMYDVSTLNILCQQSSCLNILQVQKIRVLTSGVRNGFFNFGSLDSFFPQLGWFRNRVGLERYKNSVSVFTHKFPNCAYYSSKSKTSQSHGTGADEFDYKVLKLIINSLPFLLQSAKCKTRTHT